MSLAEEGGPPAEGFVGTMRMEGTWFIWEPQVFKEFLVKWE